MLKKLKKSLYELVGETASVTKELLIILIPVVVVVKILKSFGAIDLLGQGLEPFMSPLGLPGELGLVWAAAILTNIYGAIATLLSITLASPLTEAQATILGTMILIAHGLPAEVLLCRKVAGVWKTFLFLRLAGALVLGFILNQVFLAFDLFNKPANIVWVAQQEENSLLDWLINQTSSFAFMIVVLFSLLALMRTLKALGFFDFACRIIQPLFRITGISSDASGIAVVGLLAGITFGSGLLIAETKKNQVSKKDIFLTVCFLCLCHGLIEDTSLILLIGGNLWGILFARVIFAVLVIALVSKFLLREKI